MAKKNNKDKGRAKVSFRSMIIAMVVALLGFLGFGGLELGNGDGADVDTGNQSGVVSEVNEDSTSKDMGSIDNEEENTFAIYVREDKLFVPDDTSDDGYKEVSIDEVKALLEQLDTTQKVVVHDDGAINKTYEEVIQVVDDSGVRK